MEHAGETRVEPGALRLFFALILFVLPAIGLAQAIGTGAPLCLPDDHTLCLNNDRFAVTAAYQQSPLGATFQAPPVQPDGRHRLLLVLRSEQRRARDEGPQRLRYQRRLLGLRRRPDEPGRQPHR